jgi:hypothetical protein
MRQYSTAQELHCLPLPIEAPNNSVRVPYSLKNCLVFYPYRPEKEICVLNENDMFKFQINLDRHGLRPIWKVCHLPDPRGSGRWGPPSVLIVFRDILLVVVFSSFSICDLVAEGGKMKTDRIQLAAGQPAL